MPVHLWLHEKYIAVFLSYIRDGVPGKGPGMVGPVQYTRWGWPRPAAN